MLEYNEKVRKNSENGTAHAELRCQTNRHHITSAKWSIGTMHCSKKIKCTENTALEEKNI